MSESIKKDVIAYIASYANMPVASVRDEYILKEDTLKLDEIKLKFLALALKDYVKKLNPSETILASDINKKGFDVKKTCELVIKKSAP
jgi:hypothetical protein